jgi:hypothetical protein
MATSKRQHANHEKADATDIGANLSVATIEGRQASAGGAWVSGTLNGHRFQALAFPAHAECPNYELGTSRISKLWLQRMADKACVANFDRGWDIRPTTRAAAAIVDFLAAGLADLVYHQ